MPLSAPCRMGAWDGRAVSQERVAPVLTKAGLPSVFVLGMRCTLVAVLVLYTDQASSYSLLNRFRSYFSAFPAKQIQLLALMADIVGCTGTSLCKGKSLYNYPSMLPLNLHWKEM